MYLIINNTRNKTSRYQGNWPLEYLEELLDNNNDIIVISLYSKTIKIPNGYTILNGIKEYHWKEFQMPLVDIVNYELTN